MVSGILLIGLELEIASRKTQYNIVTSVCVCVEVEIAEVS